MTFNNSLSSYSADNNSSYLVCPYDEYSKIIKQKPIDSSSSNKLLIFDESLLVNDVIIRDIESIGVSNRADDFLVRKYGKQTTSICAAADTQVAINPLSPCIGLNIYTMNVENKKIFRRINFNQINVTAIDDASSSTTTTTATATPVVIDEPILRERRVTDEENKNQTVIYGINENLTSFESAIMIKYYAARAIVYITRELHHVIRKHFIEDQRIWFIDALDDVTIQQENRELTLNEAIINVPYLMFHGPPVSMDDDDDD